MWLDYAEDQAQRRKQVLLKDWSEKLDQFLEFNDRNVLKNKGSSSNTKAKQHAEEMYQVYAEKRRSFLEAESERENIKALEKREKEAR